MAPMVETTADAGGLPECLSNRLLTTDKEQQVRVLIQGLSQNCIAGQQPRHELYWANKGG